MPEGTSTFSHDEVHFVTTDENSTGDVRRRNSPPGYKTFFMLNSAEHEIFSANKYENGIFIFISREIFILSYV